MTAKTFLRAAMILGAVVLLGWGGYAVAGSGDPVEPGGFLRQLGQRLHGLHGQQGHGGHPGASMHAIMARVIDELDLRADQQQQLEHIHTLLQGRMVAAAEGHPAHLAALADAVEARSLSPAQFRTQVDLHVEALRTLAYDVGDPLVALLDSLDAEQRAYLADHFRVAADRGAGDHCALR